MKTRKDAVNHERLDQVLSWAYQVGSGTTTAEEFEGLRRLDKLSLAQWRRMQHLERHLDAEELVCDCYERGSV